MGEGDGELVCDGYRVSVLQDGNVVEVCWHNTVNGLTTTELHAST